jgi:hypothetical protein
MSAAGEMAMHIMHEVSMQIMQQVEPGGTCRPGRETSKHGVWYLEAPTSHKVSQAHIVA